MKYGTINCTCGQQFYFETVNYTVTCIKCKKVYEITSYPEKIEEPQPERDDPDGVDI